MKQDKGAATVDAYRAAWATFWANMATLGDIVTGDFPDGGKDGIAPTRYQVEAVKDLGSRIRMLIEGYSNPPPF